MTVTWGLLPKPKSQVHFADVAVVECGARAFDKVVQPLKDRILVGCRHEAGKVITEVPVINIAADVPLNQLP